MERAQGKVEEKRKLVEDAERDAKNAKKELKVGKSFEVGWPEKNRAEKRFVGTFYLGRIRAQIKQKISKWKKLSR